MSEHIVEWPCSPHTWLWCSPCFSYYLLLRPVAAQANSCFFSIVEANLLLKPFFLLLCIYFYLLDYFIFGLPPLLPNPMGCLLHCWTNACTNSGSNSSTLYIIGKSGSTKQEITYGKQCIRYDLKTQHMKSNTKIKIEWKKIILLVHLALVHLAPYWKNK